MDTGLPDQRGESVSLAEEVVISFVGMTPEPVSTDAVYLAQFGVSSESKRWTDRASLTWQTASIYKWG